MNNFKFCFFVNIWVYLERILEVGLIVGWVILFLYYFKRDGFLFDEVINLICSKISKVGFGKGIRYK